MSSFFTFLFSTIFFTTLFAEKYAIQLKEPSSQKEIFEKLKKKGFSDPIAVGMDGFWMIDGDHLEDLNLNLFSTKVRVIENYFCFSTNTILVKLKTGSVAANEELIRKYDLKNHALIPNLYSFKSTVNNEADLVKVLEEITASALVKTSQINQVFSLQVNTNDPIYDRQWSISNTGTSLQFNGTPDADMEVDSAWTISEGDVNVKIAILDSGVDTLHEDLIDNILPGHDGFATDSIDTRGYPTTNFSNDGHGTACAGIAAASSNNNIGVAGIAPNCKIVPIRIFFYQDYGTGIGIQASTNTSALLNGTSYAWRSANADIISTSAGLSPLFIAALGVSTELVEEEIEAAYNEARSGAGVAMFFSSGNEDERDVLWPADLPTTIAVGASTMCDERKNPNDCSPETWASSYGTSLDILAPGVRISSTDMMGVNGYSNGDYTFTFNGTSAACPNAAGVGALIISTNPNLHARDVKAILNLTADKVANYNYDTTLIYGSWNEEVGYGRVNAFTALKAAETYASTVNVKEVQETNNFSVYPNPSKGLFWIENKSTKDQEVKVLNVLGEIIKVRKVSKLDRELLDLDSGVYFLFSSSTEDAIKIVIE